MEYYLAIDIGASSGRHMLGHIENGRLALEELHRFPVSPVKSGGHLVWDIEGIFAEVIAGLKKAGDAGKAPVSIGIDTWAVDYALLDAKDDRIGSVYCYRDARTKEIAETVGRYMPFEELYARTGVQFQQFNTLFQLAADKQQGRLDKAKTFLMLPDYLHFLLTGNKRQEYTNAVSTGMVNAVMHMWDDEIISAFGLPHGLFVPLSQPGTETGRLKKEIQDMIGYDAAVTLPATHDTASAVLAKPTGKSAVYISSGTWSLLGIERDTAETGERSMYYNYSNEGSIDFGFRLQKNIMGLWMIQQVRRECSKDISFAKLAELARGSRISETVDVNDEAFFAPENMTKAISAKAGRDLNLGETAYCVYNSLAISYAESIKQLESLTGREYNTVNIIGGGCNNELLNELTAEKTGKRVVAGPGESTAIGNLVMQMIGRRRIADLASARRIVKKSFGITEVTI